MARNDDDLIRQAESAEATPEIAARILPLVDLTSLKGDETEADIGALVEHGMRQGRCGDLRVPGGRRDRSSPSRHGPRATRLGGQLPRRQ